MHQHDINADVGFGKKSLQSYIVGFGLSLALTLFSFYCVEKRLFTDLHLYVVLTILAITQLLVQSICFIRLNGDTDGRWNLLPFLFAVLIISILVGGSLWIMYNLNYNMTN